MSLNELSKGPIKSLSKISLHIHFNGTKITMGLNELNNSDNLEDGKPSNTLFTYFVTSPEYFMHFEPQSPQYKKLKNDTITSLTLAITDQNNDIITDGPEVTVVLHIR